MRVRLRGRREDKREGRCGAATTSIGSPSTAFMESAGSGAEALSVDAASPDASRQLAVSASIITNGNSPTRAPTDFLPQYGNEISDMR